MLIKNIHPNQLCSKLIDNAKRQKLALDGGGEIWVRHGMKFG